MDNKFVRRTKHLFSNPKRITSQIVRQYLSGIRNDKTYLSLLYFSSFWRFMNWKTPTTFNEKMTWLKLKNRKELYTTLADKFEVKKYVEDVIGKEYVVENYAVVDKWEDINFDELPEKFVMKCTHDSGGAFRCLNKETFVNGETKTKIENNLKTSTFKRTREWPYKDIKPRIIIDKFLDDHTGTELRDYKFWCFNGRPVYMYCTIKASNVFENFYDMDFNVVDIDHGFKRHVPEFEKPSQFEKMKELASKLSKDIPFVRVDFFEVDGKVYFGEFTFFDWGGLKPFKKNWDLKLGNLLKLPI